jgi:hypothetical protein
MEEKKNSQQITYTLLFPFTLIQGEELSNLLVDRKIQNLTFTIEKPSHKYVLKVEGFISEKAACDYVNYLWSVFAWLLVNSESGMPFNANLEFGHAHYPIDPRKAAENLASTFGVSAEEGEIVDILADGNLPIVFRSDQKIQRLFGGELKCTKTRSFETFVSTLEQLSTTDISNVVNQPELKIALELFNAFFYEFSDNAKFIGLIMVLETLKPKAYKHKVVVELLNEWKKQATDEMNTFDNNTIEYEALIDLSNDLMFKNEASIRSRVKALVRETYKESDEKAEKIRTVNKLYDLRSRLVHDGKLQSNELSSAIEQAKIIVVAVLKAKLLDLIM